MDAIGARIKTLRQGLHLRQSDIAAKLSVEVRTYASWERDERRLPLRHIASIAALLNVTTDFLLGSSASIPMFKNRLIEERTKKGLTQEMLAGLSGVSQSAISIIEKGKRSPSEETMLMLAKALGTRLSDMLNGPQIQANPKEEEVLALFKLLNDNTQKLVIKTLRIYATDPTMLRPVPLAKQAT